MENQENTVAAVKSKTCCDVRTFIIALLTAVIVVALYHFGTGLCRIYRNPASAQVIPEYVMVPVSALYHRGHFDRMEGCRGHRRFNHEMRGERRGMRGHRGEMRDCGFNREMHGQRGEMRQRGGKAMMKGNKAMRGPRRGPRAEMSITVPCPAPAAPAPAPAAPAAVTPEAAALTAPAAK